MSHGDRFPETLVTLVIKISNCLTWNRKSAKIFLVVEKQWDAEIAQLVEHTTENCSVHSSILCLGTKNPEALTSGFFLFHY